MMLAWCRSILRPMTIFQRSIYSSSSSLEKLSNSKQSLSTVAAAQELPLSIKLYQYSICPFCHKVKTVLAYAAHPYTAIEVNPLTKSQLKSLPTNYKKVPIAIINGTQTNGSQDIISSLLFDNNTPPITAKLEAKWAGTPMTMDKFVKNEQWADFATQKLGRILYPNICGSWADSYDAFGYVESVDDFSKVEKVAVRRIGALAMYFAAGRIKSKHGIKDEKKALDDTLALFAREGLDGGNKDFASGTVVPDLGDLSVFGTLYSIEGLRVHKEILGRHEIVNKWYAKMKGEVYDQ